MIKLFTQGLMWGRELFYDILFKFLSHKYQLNECPWIFYLTIKALMLGK